MKNYTVKSFHEVFVDDYNEGYSESINSYFLQDEVKAGNAQEAVTTYLNDNLGYNLGFEDCEVCPDENGLVMTSCLVDKDNLQPSDHDLKMWKMGKVKLYSDNILIYVYEQKEVAF